MMKPLDLAQPTLVRDAPRTPKRQQHAAYCSAGQPAACPGYFADDKLPCVCGASETVLHALSEVAVPVVPIGNDQVRKSREMRPVA